MLARCYAFFCSCIFCPSSCSSICLYLYKCASLVAAKTCYFGLGGGTRQFEASLEADGTFESRVVFVTDSGVQREILELRRKAVEGGT